MPRTLALLLCPARIAHHQGIDGGIRAIQCAITEVQGYLSMQRLHAKLIILRLHITAAKIRSPGSGIESCGGLRSDERRPLSVAPADGCGSGNLILVTHVKHQLD